MNEKIIKTISIFICAILLLPTMNVSAMHIMEGFLPPLWCISWGVLSIPFIVFGYFSIKKKIEGSSKKLLLFAMCGAFSFVLSALKMPSITGSSSHPTGIGLGAILFGATSMSIIGLIVLLFQALLLAHGGLTTLGANVFSMSIFGAFVAFWSYLACKKLKINKSVSIFIAAFLGDMFAYVLTSLQLALAHPDSGGNTAFAFVKFLSVFSITQLPIAISDGLLTVIVFNGLKKYSSKELDELEAINVKI